jgi:hypothetical protein
MDRREALANLTRYIVGAIDAAKAYDEPFFYLRFERVFPDDMYAAMLGKFPAASDYRALPAPNNGNIQADGSSTRVKIDLFPEYIRRLPADKHAVWSLVGNALCSDEVKQAFVRRLAPGLKRRFGERYGDVGMFPIPVLTRDIPNYRITPHTDTRWKGITVQFYLPPDDSTRHIGTIFLRRTGKDSFAKVVQMPFSPNTGYAFAVGDNTWHSADPVGPEVKTRDSILHTYFVDAGLLRVVRNRAKRAGNFVLHEARGLAKAAGFPLGMR